MNRSTSLITCLIEEITNCIDQKLFAEGVIFDLKKAFDTMDRGILINKLEQNGIRAVVMKWIQTYLTKQQHYVIGEHKSDYLDIVCGVSHGSVLRSKHFVLHINDIWKVPDALKLIPLADDANILYTGETFCGKKSQEMKKLKRWFDRNKFSEFI